MIKYEKRWNKIEKYILWGYGGLRGITERLRGGLIGAPHLSSALGPAEWGSGPAML